MALHVQSSFSGGELDPALHERTTFDKYQSGLKTGRNVIVGKTGRLISPMGRTFFALPKHADRECILYSPPFSGYLIEWGHLYVRIYTFDGTLVGETAHTWTEAELSLVRFVPTVDFVYVCGLGKTILKLNYTTAAFVTGSLIFATPAVPALAYTTATGTGHNVEYAVTMLGLANKSSSNSSTGLEQEGTAVLSAVTPIPINVGEVVDIRITPPPSLVAARGAKVYRRPSGGGAFGYIGTTTAFDGTYFHFKDYGGAADYTQSYPFTVLDGYNGLTFLSKDGLIYQERLLLLTSSDLEAILASRPGLQNNFLRDVPLNSASALAFKAGSSGYAKVLRMTDSDGLVVFTNVGVFLHTGELSPTNLALVRKGPWIIDERVPPLSIPGGVLFVDKSTNSIRVLAWSTELSSYSGNELSTYSGHIFLEKRVSSWAFHEGEPPLLWVNFADGTCASFTYEPSQQMSAWTRHDYDETVDQVCGTGTAGLTFFLTTKGDIKAIEYTNGRYVSAEDLETDPEAYMGVKNALMTGIKSFKTLLNDSLVGTDTFDLTPVVAGDWDGELTLTCGTSGIFTALTYGAVGTILRWFDTDGAVIDLEVTARASDNSVTVEPDSEFPEAQASAIRLYETMAHVTGLQHLEGEYPAVMVDGGVVCSPNNDVENYPALQVVGGVITLPTGMRGAIIHVGRPVTCDIETLDIDTVEQRPTLLESQTVNKVYIRTHQTRGLYVGNKFPANDKVNGMQDLESYIIDPDETGSDLIGNTYNGANGRRHEITLPGDWKSNGRVCVRQVDPVHFEILSIIPDTEDQRR